MWKGSRLKSLISVCLNNVNHQTGCGRAPLEDSQCSQFLVLLDLTLIPMVCTRKTPLYVPFILLYKEPCHVRTEEADVPTAPGGFDSRPLWPLMEDRPSLSEQVSSFKSCSPVGQVQVKSQVYSISKLQSQDARCILYMHWSNNWIFKLVLNWLGN